MKQGRTKFTRRTFFAVGEPIVLKAERLVEAAAGVHMVSGDDLRLSFSVNIGADVWNAAQPAQRVEMVLRTLLDSYDACGVRQTRERIVIEDGFAIPLTREPVLSDS